MRRWWGAICLAGVVSQWAVDRVGVVNACAKSLL